MLQNKLRFVKQVIYRMKRSYGLPVDYYQIATHDVDPSTGIKTTTLTKIKIDRAVVLRAREFRSFVYDLAYISANKDFTEGGFFDPEDRRIIIDAKDVDINFVPKTGDYIIFDNKRLDVKEVFDFEDRSSWALITRKIPGVKIVRIEEGISVLNLTQEVSSVVVDKLIRSPVSNLNITQTLTEVP